MALLHSTTAPTLTHLPSPSSPPKPLISHHNQTNAKHQNISINSNFIKPTNTVVPWTFSISRLCRNGQLTEAANELTRMRLAGIEPNHITFITILSAFADFPSKIDSLGGWIHGYVCKLGLDKKDVMVGTALLAMYAKCGFVDKARLVFDYMEVKNSVTSNTMIDGYMRNGNIDDAVNLFDEMPDRDLISWTALINGFVKRGYYEEALDWFRGMIKARVEPDYVTAIAVLSACANLGALSIGLWIHRFVLSQDYRYNVRINNSLIDMYARCGCIEFAHQVFKDMQKRTLVSWNSIIGGLAANGYAEEALHYFQEMQRKRFKPDAVTFTGALTACSHSGLIEKGLEYFEKMKKLYKINPRIEHYGCIVDLYSRAGKLQDALNMIKNMPMKPNIVVLGSLLAACRTHGNNIGLAESLLKYLGDSGWGSDSNFVTLANMYASEGRWDGASEVRRKMKALGLRKKPGFSAVEIGESVHEFVAGDRCHGESERIYEMLELVSWDLGISGYVPGNGVDGGDVNEND